MTPVRPQQRPLQALNRTHIGENILVTLTGDVTSVMVWARGAEEDSSSQKAFNTCRYCSTMTWQSFGGGRGVGYVTGGVAATSLG